MNCNTCRYELSQCLDGRLPSGRRAVVMEHTEACDDCGAFWAELQAAQRLTLQLPRMRVGADFRDSLWDRIKAGEGTPAAVFREPVQLVTKIRYALTGAAAAAIVLWSAMWLHDDGGATARQDIAKTGITKRHAEPIDAAPPSPTQWVFDDHPLLAAGAKPLTFDVVALETARQLEDRHASASRALRALDRGPAAAADGAVRNVIDSADQFRVFGEVLLDMFDRRRVSFSDADVATDLRVAVKMLEPVRRLQPNVNTVEAVVVPALGSARLGAVSRKILVAPTLDPFEEMEGLQRLNAQRPDVMSQLFEMSVSEDAGAFRPGLTYRMAGDCGTIWVIPRSNVTIHVRR